MRRSRFTLLLSLLLPFLTVVPAAAQSPLEETTIAQVHQAFANKCLTCRELVSRYLGRIAAYDKNGPAFNSLIRLNPAAETQATELDSRYAASGLTGPLHCVPVIVKDNMETAGLATTNGALVFANYMPVQDAFQVQRIKEDRPGQIQLGGMGIQPL